MKTVRILGPMGSTFAVFEVVLQSEGEVLSFLRTASGPREAPGRYGSLQDALDRNRRATTSAELVDVADLDEARAMVT